MSERHAYEFQVLVTPTQPLSHGQGTEGNIQVLRRTQRNVCVNGEWMALEVPSVSGSAFKAVLREAAVDYYLDALGVPEGSLSRDGLRLLLKGGKVGPSGQGTPHEEARRLRRLFPPLAVFGFMDGAITSPGLLQSCELVPYTVELVEGGFFKGMAGRLSLPYLMEAVGKGRTVTLHGADPEDQTRPLLEGEPSDLYIGGIAPPPSAEDLTGQDVYVPLDVLQVLAREERAMEAAMRTGTPENRLTAATRVQVARDELIRRLIPSTVISLLDPDPERSPTYAEKRRALRQEMFGR